ncbi:glycosyltransferase family 2 protein [Nitrosococcus oceani]|uniref:glycosyltransferase family 2 protein n=1 Tax=Nitrosococcus oceani TaxID=1229 RepID=UPI0004E8A3D8|nr:glycosyltransferase family 2 protein [Nitrosococcus oceani]KFI23342.1 glycosyl transferase [Nitrosococcus oceani]
MCLNFQSFSAPARLAVLIPAHNEAATIDGIVRAAKEHLGGDVVVIDDASTDGTAQIARSAGATVLPLSCNLGAWGATQAGIRYALKANYQQVMTMDADGQHLPEYLPLLLTTLVSGEADVVIGACTERGSRARQLAWGYFRKLTGLGIEDLTSGFRAYNKAAMRVLAAPEATLLDYQDVGVLLLLRYARLRIQEIPVPMRERDHGGSRVFPSWMVVGKYMLQTSLLCLAKVGMNGKRRVAMQR